MKETFYIINILNNNNKTNKNNLNQNKKNKMKKLLLLTFIILGILNAHAQGVLTPLEDFGKVAASQNAPYKNTIKTDNLGCTYICGATWNVGNGSYDGFLRKLDSKGNTLWTQTFGDTGLDFFTNMFILHDTAIYLTGLKTNTTADLWAVKVTAAGVVRWENTFDGAYGSYDCGGALVANDSGACYITGGSFNSNMFFSDMVVLKLSNSSGSMLLSNFWDNSSYNLNDAANAITLDSKSIFIAGATQETGGYHYATVKFNKNNLAYSASTISTATTSVTIDEVKDFKENSTGIYLVGKIQTGTQGSNMCLIKLDTALSTIFSATYNDANYDDEAESVCIDASGNIFVTGFGSLNSNGTYREYLTLKYSATGTLLWHSSYADANHGDNEATSIIVDNSASQNVYVTGFSPSVMNGLNYHTIKLTNGTGGEIWHIESDGTDHLSDIPCSIILDDFSNIIVSGESLLANGKYEYKVCKYVERTIITNPDLHNEATSARYLYYENKSQIVSADSTHSQVTNERYYTNNTYPKLYFANNSFSFVFARIDTAVATQDTMQRIDVTFPNCDLDNAKIYSLEEQPTYLNYYLPQCGSNGITEVHGNKRLVIPNIYPNIDLQYYSNNAGLKYYFIVKPGAHVTDIEELFTGESSTALDTATGVLTINSIIGHVAFQRPKAYQLSATNTVITLTDSIAFWHSLGSNTYNFNMGTYDVTKPLIIEVMQNKSANSVNSINNLTWSTYYAGAGEDIANDVTTDTNNNVFVVGYTQSDQTSFPLSTGLIFQGSFGGGVDAFVLKFDYGATQMYATYYGTGGDDYGFGIAVGTANNLYITGTIANSTSLPSSSTNIGIYQQTAGHAGYNAYISEFDATTGFVTWETFFGGSAITKGYKVAVDNANNVFLAGRVQYTTNFAAVVGGVAPDSGAATGGFPTYDDAGGAYVDNAFSGSSLGGTNQDAMIAKFHPNHALAWSTIFGGYNFDDAKEIAIDPVTQDVAITGETQTDTTGNNVCNPPSNGGFPMCNYNSSSYYQTTYIGAGGFGSGYIARFTNNGLLKWSTYFDGVAGGLIFNSLGDLYISGLTYNTVASPSNLPPTNGGHPVWNPNGEYVQPSSSASDLYINEFNTSNQLIWGTKYGGSTVGTILTPFDELGTTDLAVDSYNNIIMTGATQLTSTGSNDFPTVQYSLTPYYFDQYNQSANNIASSFIASFSAHDRLTWATIYGGTGNGSQYDGHDYGMAVATSPDNNLYVVGFTHSQNFPYTCPAQVTGVPYCSDDTTSTSFDAFIGRFDIHLLALLGVSEHSQQTHDLQVFPNPATNELNYQFDVANKENIKISIHNIIGQIVYSEQIQNAIGTYKKQINISNFTNGMYFIKIEFENGTISKKFIKN